MNYNIVLIRSVVSFQNDCRLTVRCTPEGRNRRWADVAGTWETETTTAKTRRRWMARARPRRRRPEKRRKCDKSSRYDRGVVLATYSFWVTRNGSKCCIVRVHSKIQKSLFCHSCFKYILYTTWEKKDGHTSPQPWEKYPMEMSRCSPQKPSIL